MQKTRLAKAGVVLLGLTLVGAACGSDNSSSSSGGATTAAPRHHHGRRRRRYDSRFGRRRHHGRRRREGGDAHRSEVQRHRPRLPRRRTPVRTPASASRSTTGPSSPSTSSTRPTPTARSATRTSTPRARPTRPRSWPAASWATASIVGLVGPAFSGESKNADPIFNEAGLPTVTASATNAHAAEQRLDHLPSHAGQRRRAGPRCRQVHHGHDQAPRRCTSSTTPRTTARAWPTASRRRLGAAVIGSDTIDPKATDYSATVTKVKAAAPDAVFFGGYYAQAGPLSKQLRDGGVTAPSSCSATASATPAT